MIRQLSVLFVLAVLSACSRREPEPVSEALATAAVEPTKTDVPAGAYTLDKARASLLFRVDHLGFSMYTARFRQFDAQLQFDPANLAASSVTVTVDPASIETDFPDPAAHDFNAQLRSEQWLNTAQFPQMTFRSLRRSEFGMGFGVPEPGSKMGVSDGVEIIIETEFSGPPLNAAKQAS